MITIDIETLKYYFQELMKFCLIGGAVITTLLGKYLLAIILVLLLIAIQIEEIIELFYSIEEIYEDALPGDKEKKE